MYIDHSKSMVNVDVEYHLMIGVSNFEPWPVEAAKLGEISGKKKLGSDFDCDFMGYEWILM